MYSIGQISKLTGVKVPTIRYYENMGLLPNAGRTAGNQRRYDRAGLDRLAFIKHGRDLGLSIEMIKDLIVLGQDTALPCEKAHQIASQHAAAIRQRIVKLQTLEAELQRIETACDAGTVGTCLVLAALNDHDMCATEH